MENLTLHLQTVAIKIELGIFRYLYLKFQEKMNHISYTYIFYLCKIF